MKKHKTKRKIRDKNNKNKKHSTISTTNCSSSYEYNNYGYTNRTRSPTRDVVSHEPPKQKQIQREHTRINSSITNNNNGGNSERLSFVNRNKHNPNDFSNNNGNTNYSSVQHDPDPANRICWYFNHNICVYQDNPYLCHQAHVCYRCCSHQHPMCDCDRYIIFNNGNGDARYSGNKPNRDNVSNFHSNNNNYNINNIYYWDPYHYYDENGNWHQIGYTPPHKRKSNNNDYNNNNKSSNNSVNNQQPFV